jgi:uncharacterized protein DUF6894
MWLEVLVLHHRTVFRLLSVTESQSCSRLVQVEHHDGNRSRDAFPPALLSRWPHREKAQRPALRPDLSAGRWTESTSAGCRLAARVVQEQELAGKQHKPRLTAMQKFFFDMKDGVPMRDRIGLEFETNADAIAHCGALAKHFFDESLVDDQDLEISVVNALGREIHREFVHRR